MEFLTPSVFEFLHSRDPIMQNLFSHPVIKETTPWYSMYKDETSYTIILKLAGCKKESISIEIEKNLLVVTAKTSFDLGEKQLSKGERLSSSDIKKTFDISYLLEDYDISDAESSYVDGVLKIDFNKKDRIVTKVPVN